MDGGRELRRRRGITPELQQAAWQLRHKTTPAEQILWDALRDRQCNGLRFRRQHPVGQFVLDFYCSLHKLAVELDGSVHDTQSEQDAARTTHLNAHGYRVIRFSNEEVFANLPNVLERIANVVKEESL